MFKKNYHITHQPNPSPLAAATPFLLHPTTTLPPPLSSLSILPPLPHSLPSSPPTYPDGSKVFCLEKCSVHCALHATTTKSINIRTYIGGLPQPPVRIVGLSNGLVCIDECGYLLLRNSSIQKCKKLSDFGLERECAQACSFGYDDINDGYKCLKSVKMVAAQMDRLGLMFIV